ncbi:homocysteine S-methyltransferase family protein [Salinivibrio kushneri]
MLARYRWQTLGANTIGDCCDIAPKHIKALADWTPPHIDLQLEWNK